LPIVVGGTTPFVAVVICSKNGKRQNLGC
jgi:hypothetical protein